MVNLMTTQPPYYRKRNAVSIDIPLYTSLIISSMQSFWAILANYVYQYLYDNSTYKKSQHVTLINYDTCTTIIEYSLAIILFKYVFILQYNN